MPTEGSHKPFKRKRVSIVPAGHLGGLGGLGVSVLKVKQLDALDAGQRKVVREVRVGTTLVRKCLEIITGACHFGEY